MSSPTRFHLPIFSTPVHDDAAKPWPAVASASFSQLPLSVQTWAVQFVVYHVAALLFEAADDMGLLQEYKIRKRNKSVYYKLLPTVLRNQIFVLLPFMYLSELVGWCFTGVQHLWIPRFLASLPAMAIGHDVVQYIGHRYILHWPNVWLMKTFRHSVHHSTKANSALSACYMSAADFLVEIVCPYLLPLASIGGGGSDRIFHFLISGTGALGGLYEHSGFDFSYIFRPREDPAVEHAKAEAIAAGKTIIETEEDAAIAKSNAAIREHDAAMGPAYRLVANFLADFLDNRSHLEHHRRGYVSFSDGFGSPGICDTLFNTRWFLSERRMLEVEKEWKRQHIVNEKDETPATP